MSLSESFCSLGSSESSNDKLKVENDVLKSLVVSMNITHSFLNSQEDEVDVKGHHLVFSIPNKPYEDELYINIELVALPSVWNSPLVRNDVGKFNFSIDAKGLSFL